MTTNIEKYVDEDAWRVTVDPEMEDYPNRHYDGSPTGNAHVNAEEFKDLANCPDKGCPALGGSYKCYNGSFSQCNTYKLRNG